MLFHCAGLPRAPEANHAFVTDPRADLMAAVADVVRFYEERCLQPRIDGALVPGQLKRLRPALTAHGFSVLERREPRPALLVLSRASAIRPNRDLAVRRVTGVGADVAALIADEGEFAWTVDLIRRRVDLDPGGYHLLVGYYKGNPVAMASLSLFVELSRVDDVMTRAAYWGRGFARTVMHELVSYHRRLSRSSLYLWVTNPIARRVYEDAGFVEQPLDVELWTAWRG